MTAEGILIALSIIAVVAAGLYQQQRQVELRHLLMWRAAVAAIALDDVEESWKVGGGISGRKESLRIEMDRTASTQGEGPPRVRITGTSGITLRLGGFGSEIGKGIRPGYEIGDPEFDRETHVTGPRDVMRAVFDADTRRLLRELLHGHLQPGTHSALASLRDGVLEVTFRDSSSQAFRPRFPHLVTSLVDIARRLEPPARIAERIATNTRTETLWQVRLANLRLLAEMYPQAPEARQALEHGCGDPHDEVRLLAAAALGEGGSDTLWELASRPSTDASCAARAILALGPSVPLTARCHCWRRHSRLAAQR
jgi:hypothetical protein